MLRPSYLASLLIAFAFGFPCQTALGCSNTTINCYTKNACYPLGPFFTHQKHWYSPCIFVHEPYNNLSQACALWNISNVIGVTTGADPGCPGSS